MDTIKSNKKIIFIIIFIIASILTCSFCFVNNKNVFGEESNFQTIITNPNDSHYLKIDDISSIGILDNQLYFTNDKLSIYDLDTKSVLSSNLLTSHVDILDKYVVLNIDGQMCLYNNQTTTKISAINDEYSYLHFDTFYYDNYYILTSYINDAHIYIAYYELDDSLNKIQSFEYDITNEFVSGHGISEVVSLTCQNDGGYILYKDDSSTLRTASFSTKSGQPILDRNITLENVQFMDYVTLDNEIYLVIFDNNNKIVIRDKNQEHVTTYTSSSSEIYELGKVHSPIDICASDNIIYIADNYYGSVYGFELKNNALSPTNTIIASSGSDDSRFFNVSTIYSYDKNNIYVVDSGNNRIKQIQNDSTVNIIKNQSIEDENHFLYMQDMLFDSQNNLYVLRSNFSKSNSYIVDHTNNTEIDLKIFAYSFTIDENDNIYYSTNDAVYKFNTEESIKMFDSQNMIGKHMLKLFGLNTFVSYNGSQLVINDTQKETLIDTGIAINDIAIDMENNIYVLHPNSIDKYNAQSDYTKSYSLKTDTEYSTMSLTITSAEIYLFDNENSRLVKVVDTSLCKTPTISNEYLQKTSLSVPITTYLVNSDVSCCMLPYNIGTAITLPQNTHVFVVDNVTYPNYSMIMYYNGSLKTGFVKSSSLIVTDTTTPNNKEYKSVDTTKIYKYPVVGSIALESVPNDTLFTVTNSIIGIDNKIYYQIEYNDGYAYIISSDFVENSNQTITTLPLSNASILLNDNDYINVYDETGTYILLTLKANDRIYVPKYDKTKDMTYIIVVRNNKEIGGYISTANIKMDKMSMYEIFAVIEIVVAIVALTVLAIVLVKHKKKYQNKA